jgi:predicted PurR-regulated permease PerM
MASARVQEPPQGETRAGAQPATALARTNEEGEVVVRFFDRRHAAVSTIAILALIFGLRAAAEFLIPLVFSIILSYALEPVVHFLLHRLRIPRVMSAGLVVLAVISLIGVGILGLHSQVTSIANGLPTAAARISGAVNGLSSGDGTMLDKVRSAAELIRKSAAPADPKERAPVRVDSTADKFESMLVAGSMSVAAFFGQSLMVGFLVFFILASGDIFKRKFIKVCGHTLSEKKITVHMLDQINRSIRMYMAMLVVTNVLLSLVTWAAFRFIGLQNAGTFAVVAGALHMVPYFGPLLVAVITGIAAIVQFGEVGPALLTAATSLVIASVIGMLVQTWMTGRIARMNAVAVFVILLLFTWMWGVWGTLLSIPIAVIVKVVADHIEGLQGVAEFLGE